MVRNSAQGLSREVIEEEITAYFGAVPPPDMGAPKINPDEPGYYGSDTSSLDEESKENHGRKAYQTWKRAKVGEKRIQTGDLLQALYGCEPRASVKSNGLPNQSILSTAAVQFYSKVHLSQFLDTDSDPYPGPKWPSIYVRYEGGSARFSSGNKGDI